MNIPILDQQYLKVKGYDFAEAFYNIIEDRVKKTVSGIVIRDWKLPKGKFSVDKSNLLILLPQGYPDIKPDMWYFNPHLFLLPNNKIPSQAQVLTEYGKVMWQRWSRHFEASDWRPGVDGIHTYLRIVDEALTISK